MHPIERLLVEEIKALRGQVGRLSSDLRSPLRAIGASSEALFEDHSRQLSPKARRLVASIRKSAKRMEKLLR